MYSQNLVTVYLYMVAVATYNFCLFVCLGKEEKELKPNCKDTAAACLTLLLTPIYLIVFIPIL